MHDLLDAAVQALDAKILADPLNTEGRFARMLEAQRVGGLMHGDRPICPFLRPHIVRRSEYEAIGSAAATVADALEVLVRRALEDDALLDELGLTEREATMARVDPGYARACVSSRLDSYLTDEGFTFLEYNGESPAGIGDQMVLERILYELPLVREFRDARRVTPVEPHRLLLEALVGTYREWGGEVERPSIAIVDWDGVPTSPEFWILRDYFESMGHATAIVDPGELAYDGRALSARGEPVDVLYKRVIIHEFLERCGEEHPISRAYVDGRACVVNAFRCKIAHKKASFAVLSDPRFEHLFSPEQLAAIRRHVPWTRRVREGEVEYLGERVPMRELLRLEKNHLVLKPNDSYGGHDVTIGRDASDARWAEMTESAFREPFVVQELVRMRKVSIPRFDGAKVVATEMTVDFDPFLFGGAVEGGLVRLSSTSLSNISSGGGETALLVVDA
jgi:hypothetical protein